MVIQTPKTQNTCTNVIGHQIKQTQHSLIDPPDSLSSRGQIWRCEVQGFLGNLVLSWIILRSSSYSVKWNCPHSYLSLSDSEVFTVCCKYFISKLLFSKPVLFWGVCSFNVVKDIISASACKNPFKEATTCENEIWQKVYLLRFCFSSNWLRKVVILRLIALLMDHFYQEHCHSISCTGFCVKQHAWYAVRMKVCNKRNRGREGGMQRFNIIIPILMWYL